MAVVVDSGELPSARGKKGHALDLVLTKWQSIADGQFEYDCRAVLQMIDEVDELRLWETAANGFYKTRDEFLQRVVLIDFDLAEQSLNEIVERLRRGEPAKLGKRGRPKKGEDKSLYYKDYGTRAAYLTARLERDRPDLLERVQAKELSARAAAIEAGFIKAVTPLTQLRAAWAKATEDERRAFLDGVKNPPLPF